MAIIRYEVVYWLYLRDGTYYKDVRTFDTLKEARAFIKHALPDYEVTNQWREPLTRGYGDYRKYVGDAKILYCEKKPAPKMADPEPAEYPDMVLNNPGGWF